MLVNIPYTECLEYKYTPDPLDTPFAMVRIILNGQRAQVPTLCGMGFAEPLAHKSAVDFFWPSKMCPTTSGLRNLGGVFFFKIVYFQPDPWGNDPI